MGFINVYISISVYIVVYFNPFTYTRPSMVGTAAIYKQFSESFFWQEILIFSTCLSWLAIGQFAIL